MPKISVIIPHRTDREHIMTVDSLMRQTLKDFELIIIPDYEKIGAAACRNQGAAMARAPYLLFLDDDLILDPSMLKRMSDVLDINPTVGLVYCDYKLAGTKFGTQQGEIWDVDLLKKRNYISTMSMVRAGIFRSLGGFNNKLQRFQDWDLWLRYARTPGARGHYIPESFFTAYFDGTGISERGKKDFIIQAKKVKEMNKSTEYEVSVIIPVHNQLQYTQWCLETVMANSKSHLEIIVINDASTDDTGKWLSEQQGIRVINCEERVGHSKAINLGANAANGDFLIFLNNDTLVPQAWDIRIVEPLINSMQISAVGPLTSSSASAQVIMDMYQRRMEARPEHIDGLDNVVVNKRERKPVPAKITGFCMATTRTIWDAVGPFDEVIEAGGNEADWLLRSMRIGLTPVIYTGLYVHHYGNVSYSQMGDVQEKWNAGNEHVKQKHGIEAYNRLEEDMWKNLIKQRK